MKQTGDPDIVAAVQFWSKYDSDAAAHEAVFADREPEETDEQLVRPAAMMRWAWLWAEDGFWSLTCGHKMAAALMCTSMSGADDLKLPGRALRVCVPDGAIRTTTREIRYLYVACNEDGAYMQFNDTREFDPDAGAESTCFGAGAANLADLLTGEIEGQLDDERENMALLCKRLIVGLLFTMQHTDNFRTKSYATSSPKRDGRGPPDHRVVFVGKPLSYDARPQVEQWLSDGKKRAPPSVQTIVRGHYKRQVIGIGRNGRKVIWVEPYWRGNEDAPILIHPRTVG